MTAPRFELTSQRQKVSNLPMLKHPRHREGLKSLEEDNVRDLYYI